MPELVCPVCRDGGDVRDENGVTRCVSCGRRPPKFFPIAIKMLISIVLGLGLAGLVLEIACS